MNTKVITLLVVIVLVVGIFFVVNEYSPNIEKTFVKNVFIDVNGDGMTDLLLEGKVILNNGATNFPIQPTNSQP